MDAVEHHVMMANQIARNLETAKDPVAATAQHMKSFWNPRMVRIIADHLAEGGQGLSETAHAACQRLID